MFHRYTVCLPTLEADTKERQQGKSRTISGLCGFEHQFKQLESLEMNGSGCTREDCRAQRNAVVQPTNSSMSPAPCSYYMQCQSPGDKEVAQVFMSFLFTFSYSFSLSFIFLPSVEPPALWWHGWQGCISGVLSAGPPCLPSLLAGGPSLGMLREQPPGVRGVGTGRVRACCKTRVCSSPCSLPASHSASAVIAGKTWSENSVSNKVLVWCSCIRS